MRIVNRANGPTPGLASGSLEVFHAGAWGSICSGRSRLPDKTERLAELDPPALEVRIPAAQCKAVKQSAAISSCCAHHTACSATGTAGGSIINRLSRLLIICCTHAACRTARVYSHDSTASWIERGVHVYPTGNLHSTSENTGIALVSCALVSTFWWL